MTDIERYINAATRENTRKSYRSAIEHFENHWGGFLPATADSVARYLAHYASKLSINTLRQRLSGLAAWHQEQGFPDPTKTPIVKKVLKGIAELHPTTPKQARPIQLHELGEVINTLDKRISTDTRSKSLQAIRDKALLLLGFWRAFRADEIARLEIAHIQTETGKGMKIFLPRSKTDKMRTGRYYHVPALQILCPVEAYIDWINAAQIQSGSVFRAIDQWGNISEKGVHPASIIGIIQRCAKLTDSEDKESFSSHSLRRGFATWANKQGWDTKSLMEYVGWKDAKSAIRYIDSTSPFSPKLLAKYDAENK